MSPWDMEWDDVVTAVTVQMRQMAAQSLPAKEGRSEDWWESEEGEKFRSFIDLETVQSLDRLRWLVTEAAKRK